MRYGRRFFKYNTDGGSCYCSRFKFISKAYVVGNIIRMAQTFSRVSVFET